MGIASEPGQLLSRFAKVCQGVAQWWRVFFVFFFWGCWIGLNPEVVFLWWNRLCFCRPSCQISDRDFRNVDVSIKQKSMSSFYCDFLYIFLYLLEDSWSRMRWCDDPDGVLESWGGFTLLDPRIWVVLPPSKQWQMKLKSWKMMFDVTLVPIR